MTEARPYHHGDLRRAIVSAALDAISESGPASVSLRDLARRAGVSHAAPAHHFGDKAGLLTAVAIDGFHLLADALTVACERTGSFLEVGVAYVRFAIDHRAHFEVMYRLDLYHADDPDVLAARARTAESLYGGMGSVPDAYVGPDPRAAAAAAWSLVHGFATLWLSGNLPPEMYDHPEAAARSVAGVLFGSA